jgi:hypothetical protein
MNHHRCVQAGECAALEQQNLATGVTDLLCGRAHHADRQPHLIGDPGGSERGTDGGGGDDVVPAGVSDAWQGVVLGANGDVQGTRASAGAKCGRQIANALLHAESGIAQQLAQPPRGLLLLETELRVRVNTMTQSDQVLAGDLEALARCSLGVQFNPRSVPGPPGRHPRH